MHWLFEKFLCFFYAVSCVNTMVLFQFQVFNYFQHQNNAYFFLYSDYFPEIILIFKNILLSSYFFSCKFSNCAFNFIKKFVFFSSFCKLFSFFLIVPYPFATFSNPGVQIPLFPTFQVFEN